MKTITLYQKTYKFQMYLFKITLKFANVQYNLRLTVI